jgi:hypothetical protein
MSKTILSKDEVLRQLRNIQPELGKNYGVTRIGIFGSVARNEAHEGSDIDVVVEMNKPKLFYLVHIKEMLENDFKKPVDVIRYSSKMNAYLKARIDSEAVYA